MIHPTSTTRRREILARLRGYVESAEGAGVGGVSGEQVTSGAEGLGALRGAGEASACDSTVVGGGPVRPCHTTARPGEAASTPALLREPRLTRTPPTTAAVLGPDTKPTRSAIDWHVHRIKVAATDLGVAVALTHDSEDARQARIEAASNALANAQHLYELALDRVLPVGGTPRRTT